MWGVYDYTIVQWNGSIENRLARNIAQVIGVGADLFTDPKDHFSPSVDPHDPFRSSVDIEGLDTVERLAEHLPQPKWPAEIFHRPIDLVKSDQGSKIYAHRCAHCHVPKQLSEPGANGGHLEPKMIPLDEIGTDPATAVNFANRTAVTGNLKTVLANKAVLIDDRMSAAPATETITTEIMKRANKAGPNDWHAPLAYMARPHKAVWATPPFLHNGSIPNLDELLSPWENVAAASSSAPCSSSTR